MSMYSNNDASKIARFLIQREIIWEIQTSPMKPDNKVLDILIVFQGPSKMVLIHDTKFISAHVQ